MFESDALMGHQGYVVTMQVSHEVAFVITGDAVAGDEIMHPAADVDGIDLHVTVVGKDRGDIGRRGIKEDGATVKAAGDGRGNVKDGTHGRLQRSPIRQQGAKGWKEKNRGANADCHVASHQRPPLLIA